MRLLDIIKKNKKLIYIYLKICESYYSMLTLISPKINTKVRYKHIYGRPLNLENPQTFVEKLLWLKLNEYMNNPLVVQCADKYRVREYVKNCGFSELLNELYGVYDNSKEIPWADLPEQFVLKWNFGAGMNIICKSKKNLQIQKCMKQLDKWGKSKYWLPYAEMQYKYIHKKIVCEKFLENDDEPGEIPDYKVYCFHGEPMAILVMHDRGHELKTEFFDTNWCSLKNTEKYLSVSKSTPKPECLAEMLNASRCLSSPFPFVRCDFYVIAGRLYFGELTFTPAGGLYLSQTKINGKEMTEYLHVPCH